MSIARETVVNFFLHQHIFLRDEWLDAVLNFLHDRNVSFENTNSLCQKVYEQWLFSDISMSMEPSTSGLDSSAHVTFLKSPMILQIKTIIDTSSSYYSQIKSFTNEFIDNSGFEALTENEKEAVQEAKAQRTLILLLTNGEKDFKTIEFKPIREISLLTKPGSKVLLLPPMKCRRGKIFLESQNFQLLGGDVESYMEMYNPIKVMSKTLGIDKRETPNKRNQPKNSQPAHQLAEPQITTAQQSKGNPVIREFSQRRQSPRRPLINIQEVRRPSPQLQVIHNERENMPTSTNRLLNKTLVSDRILNDDDFDNLADDDEWIPNDVKEIQTIEESDSDTEDTRRSRARRSVLNRVITDQTISKKTFESHTSEDFELNFDSEFLGSPPPVCVSPIVSKSSNHSTENAVLRPSALKWKSVVARGSNNRIQSPPPFYENIIEDYNDDIVKKSSEKPSSLIGKALDSDPFVNNRKTSASPLKFTGSVIKEQPLFNRNPFSTSAAIGISEIEASQQIQTTSRPVGANTTSKRTEKPLSPCKINQPTQPIIQNRAKSINLHRYFEAAPQKPLPLPTQALPPKSVKTEVIDLSDDEDDVKPVIPPIRPVSPTKVSTAVTTSLTNTSSPVKHEDPVIKCYKSMKVVKISEALKKVKFVMGSKRFTIQGIVHAITQPLRVVQGIWTMQIQIKDTSSQSFITCMVDNETIVTLVGWTAEEATRIRDSNDVLLKAEGAQRLKNAAAQIHRLDLLMEMEFFSGGSNPIIRKITSLSHLLEGQSQ